MLGTLQGQPWLGKFTARGRLQWGRQSGGELVRPRIVQAFPGGGYVVVIENWLMRFSEQGDVIWQRVLDNFGFGPYALAVRADGMLAITSAAIKIAVVDGHSGQLQWANYFTSFYDETTAPAFTQDGELLVGIGRFDASLLMRFTANGTLRWQKTFPGGISKILPLDNGEFVGATAYGTLLQFDGQGNTVWERRYTETQVQIRPAPADYYHPGFNSLIRLADGSLVAAGITTDSTQTSTPGAPESDIWVVKTDARGNLLWSRRYGQVGPENYEETGGLSSRGIYSGPPYVSGYDALVALADGIIVVGNHYKLATASSWGGPNFGLIFKLNQSGSLGTPCDWQLPSAVQTDTLQVRYGIFEQSPNIFTPTLPEIEVGLVSAPTSLTTACENTLTGDVVANAGLDFKVVYSSNVTLNGNESVDPSGAGMHYQWTQIAGPSVTLKNSEAVTPSFVAPNVVTTLIFELAVTGFSGGPTSTDTVFVSVRAPSTTSTTTPMAPTATHTATPTATSSPTPTPTSRSTVPNGRTQTATATQVARLTPTMTATEWVQATSTTASPIVSSTESTPTPSVINSTLEPTQFPTSTSTRVIATATADPSVKPEINAFYLPMVFR